MFRYYGSPSSYHYPDYYPDYYSGRSNYYSGFPSDHSRDSYYDRVAGLHVEGERLYRQADFSRHRSRQASEGLHRYYTRDLDEDATYYDPPEMYYRGRSSRSAPQGGYGPPYDYYDGAWRDGFGHDVTNPPHYSREDTTGDWSYAWPGRGHGSSY